jgi:hypothetical protein
MGFGTPPARDVLVLLGVVFATFLLQFFETSRALIELLRLTPLVVLRGYLWQLVSYPFVGPGGASIWILIELLVLYIFANTVFWRLGRRRFWQLLMWTAVGAAVAAVAVELLVVVLGGTVTPYHFLTMQGSRMLIVICIAAFATLDGDATILLFFVIPLKARWFLWLEVGVAFVFGLLPYRDAAGFVGVCTAVFLTYSTLTPGGPRKVLHDWRKQLEMLIIRQRLKRMRAKRRFDVIDGDGGRDRDEWIN